MPSKEITDDLELLLRVMPPHIRDAIHRQADLKNVIEVVMDLEGLRSWQPGRAHGYEELAAAIAFEDEFAGQPAGAREK